MAAAKEKYRQSFTVPETTDAYAPEFITFGKRTAGAQILEDGFTGVTVMVEQAVSGAIVELWLPKVGAVDETDDYFYSGRALDEAISETWALASYPGAQLRVKSGGTEGSCVLNASAD